MGLDYATLTLSREGNNYVLVLATCKDAHKGYSEQIEESFKIKSNEIYFKVDVAKDGKCNFTFSENGNDYKKIGQAFQAREGRWIGAKVGLFSLTNEETGLKGYADFDWFRIE
jgi:hypothetical protein